MTELFNSKFRSFKYHDPLGGYPDLVEKNRDSGRTFHDEALPSTKVDTVVFFVEDKIYIFRGGSNASEFY